MNSPDIVKPESDGVVLGVEQVSQAAGVGVATAPGNPMSPAFADKFADESRQRASSEVASNLFMGFTPGCKY